MSQEKTIRVQTFSGKTQDWNMWAEKFLAKASIRGYDAILDGTTTVEADSTTTLTKEQEKARELNKIAYNELVLSAGDNVTAGLIKTAKFGKIKKGDAKDAWEKLKAKHEPSTGQELVNLNKAYMAKEMKNSGDPEEFITELEEIRARMAEDPFNEMIAEKSFCYES